MSAMKEHLLSQSTHFTWDGMERHSWMADVEAIRDGAIDELGRLSTDQLVTVQQQLTFVLDALVEECARRLNAGWNSDVPFDGENVYLPIGS